MEKPLQGFLSLVFFLFITSASISFLPSSARDQFSKTDAQALQLFKNSIQKDPNGVLSGWQPSSDQCSWYGVSCSASRVTQLDLSSANVVGAVSLFTLASLDMLSILKLSDNNLSLNSSSLLQLPPSLKQLDLSAAGLAGTYPAGFLSKYPNLAYVDLSRNNLTGLLPGDILLNADNLQILDLSQNNLSGSISGLVLENSCKSLLHFDISGNHFVDSVPFSLSSCAGLKNLILSHNDFTGELPSSFSQFQGLQQLDVSHNQLTGWIPVEFGNKTCQSLVQLSLSDNNITGPIPLSLASCSSLVVLDLANNNISGPFPDSIIGKLRSLQRLLVSNNSITGPLPPSLFLSKSLKVADFSSNKLSGAIPTVLCSGASSLEELRAPDNLITGEIPGELSLCSQLKTIDLSINYLTGPIPPSLGRLPNLEHLMVWFNGLRGGIPPELGQCSKLKNLIVNNNFLSGKIPMELFKCSNLEWISLTSNRISGEIPTQFGQLSRLAVLQLANNSLAGEIPREIGNCSSLLWLDLNSNNLTGEIPPRLGRQLGDETLSGILSGNTIAFVRNVGNSCKGVGGLLEFAGIRPERLLQVPTLKTCDLTRLYSGAALSGWTHYLTLEYLDLSYNDLQGSIPAEFGDMLGLQVLDLARNRLSGEIPSSLGKLSNLGVFDASHNRLQGQIPDSFSNISFLVQIDLSDNALSGPIPSRGQLSTLPASQFANNPGLCGVPLPPCGVLPPAELSGEAARSGRRGGAMPWTNSVILGIMVSLAFVCILTVWAVAMRARRREAREVRMLNSLRDAHAATTWKIGGEKEPLSINVATFQRQLRKLNFSALIEATNGFSAESLIGCGGFGEVFKATLKDGSSVAIKKLIQLSCQGDREFMAEMETLGKIKHRNLVPLLGYCKIGEERLLVYEFMQFGSLEEMLHGRRREKVLTWEERKKIARGAAKGLCFLHHNCIPHIIHRDMKSSNVLLDKDMEARVSDFGMARLISALDTHLSVSTLAGTPGYVPPEYYQSFRCTAKGDVYSFGVVVLELLTGRRPTDKEDFGDTNLVGWVKMKVREGTGKEVLDGELRKEEEREMWRCLEIAMQCVEDFPSRRPNMLQVVAMLRELVALDGDPSAS